MSYWYNLRKTVICQTPFKHSVMGSKQQIQGVFQRFYLLFFQVFWNKKFIHAQPWSFASVMWLVWLQTDWLTFMVKIQTDFI